MIVLTGGAGFIGSCFLWRLNKEGIDDIIVVDHLDESDKWKNLAGKKFRDYIQKDQFLELVQKHKLPKPECVVHMGACSSTVLKDADYFVKNNYKYSKVLAEWALINKSSFIYASSAATYGDGSLGYSDDNSVISDLRPLNMYGFSKHMFDMWAIKSGLLDKVTGLKFFNVFGPNEYHKGEMMSVICKKFEEVRDKGVISLFKSYKNEYADGEQKRDFIYIKDAVDIMYFFFKNTGKTGIFNVGTGNAHSWNDLAKAMFKALNKKPKINYTEMPGYLKPKYQYFTEARMEKLYSAGYEGTMSDFEETVADYIKYLDKGEYL